MKISILTIFPNMFEGFKTTSIINRAIENKQIEFNTVDFRLFTNSKHQKVDDIVYGGGHGMLLMVQPIVDALKSIDYKNAYVVLLGPTGSVFNQQKAHELAQKDHLIFICGHYEGVDHRVRHYIDEELSIGDYILTGGELASMVISDAVIRLKDDVILPESHQDESFENNLLEYPQYTRPRVFEGHSVPEVLLSGHHKNIREWKLKQSLLLTLKNRPDLLNREKTEEELKLLNDIQTFE